MNRYAPYAIILCGVLQQACKSREFNRELSISSPVACSPSNLKVCCPIPYEVQQLEGRTSAIICRKGNDVLGPSPEGMVKRCVQMSAGTSDAQAACQKSIWNYDLVNSLWGRDRCPTNTSWNSDLAACFESNSNNVFGPFAAQLVSKCTAG